MRGAAGRTGRGGLLAVRAAIACRVRASVVWFWAFWGRGVVRAAGW